MSVLYIVLIKTILLCLNIVITTSLGLQDLVENIELDEKIVLHNGRTMAEVQRGNSSLVFCTLSVVDERRKEKHIAKLEKEDFIVKFIDFETMLAVLDACDELTEYSIVNRVDTDVVDSKVGFWSLIRGIVPGTLWCGLNDIAESYDSLGSNYRVDRCCRAHDHCPDKIKSFSRKQGLLNSTPYTKSNCECDRRFFNCLKNSNSSAGDSVGKFYFNFLNLQCIDLRHPERCTKWKYINVGNNSKVENNETTTDDILKQEEDIFVPNIIQNISTLESDIENTKSGVEIGIIQLEEEILRPINSTDFESEPRERTECETWEIDVKQNPKLSFVDNSNDY
eukprot:GFUD01041336.1.p1 GENE.GFUD01041336.1~~GFUD01041336.1.p1  ORF type:complete len:337 (-),score=54.09 GFUD01041336.1:121-1131(-)